jgi:hypothetical protein
MLRQRPSGNAIENRAAVSSQIMRKINFLPHGSGLGSLHCALKALLDFIIREDNDFPVILSHHSWLPPRLLGWLDYSSQ